MKCYWLGTLVLREEQHVIKFKPQIPKSYFFSKAKFEISRQIPLFILLGISQVLKGMRFLITGSQIPWTSLKILSRQSQ